MTLSYLDYLDLSDALNIAISRMKYYIAEAGSEKEREHWDKKEARYQELYQKLKHYAADNLY